MKWLLMVAVVMLLFGSTSTRVREKRTLNIAAKELGISTDSLCTKLAELETLIEQLNEVE